MPEYALEHGGVLYRLDAARAPELDVSREGRRWRWRLDVPVRRPDGREEPLAWQGHAASEAEARIAAHAFARRLLRGQGWSLPPEKTGAAASPVWKETKPPASSLRKPLPRLVKAEKVQRGASGRAVLLKRDCVTGRFAPARARANDCRLPERPAPWWRGMSQRPDVERVCYATRNDALRLFRYANRDLIDRAGGLDQVMSRGEFDAVNERSGLAGRRRVRTLAAAIEAVMPHRRPYCLDALDIETLNETTPGQAVGGFRLPDAVAERKLLEKLERDYARGGDEVPF